MRCQIPAFRKMLAKYRGAMTTNNKYTFQLLKSNDITHLKVERYLNEPEKKHRTLWAANSGQIFSAKGLQSHREKQNVGQREPGMGRHLKEKQLLLTISARKKNLRSRKLTEEPRSARARARARIASTRAISYFAFRCYSEIVANCPAWNRWPVRCFLPHLSRFLSIPIPLSPLTNLPAAALSRFSPALLTRRDVLLMKMKRLLIFSLLAESRPGSCSPSFFLSIVDLFSLQHYDFHFPRRSHCRGKGTHRVSPFSLPLCSPSLALSPAAVILLFVYTGPALSGECDNELGARN